MREDIGAELQIYCAKCGNYVNEYNWTLEAAAVMSHDGRQVPTLASVLLRLLDGETPAAIDYTAYCPRCHEKVPLRQITPPSREELLSYIDRVGWDYVRALF